jgi:hypothetical protein
MSRLVSMRVMVINLIIYTEFWFIRVSFWLDERPDFIDTLNNNCFIKWLFQKMLLIKLFLKRF